MVVGLLEIELNAFYIVEPTPLQIQNFLVFVEIGIFGEFFRWPRTDSVYAVTVVDSFSRRIYTNFYTRRKANAVRLHRRGVSYSCHVL